MRSASLLWPPAAHEVGLGGGPAVARCLGLLNKEEEGELLRSSDEGAVEEEEQGWQAVRTIFTASQPAPGPARACRWLPAWRGLLLAAAFLLVVRPWLGRRPGVAGVGARLQPLRGLVLGNATSVPGEVPEEHGAAGGAAAGTPRPAPQPAVDASAAPQEGGAHARVTEAPKAPVPSGGRPPGFVVASLAAEPLLSGGALAAAPEHRAASTLAPLLRVQGLPSNKTVARPATSGIHAAASGNRKKTSMTLAAGKANASEPVARAYKVPYLPPNCAKPLVPGVGQCVCPPPSVLQNGTCARARGPQLMTFYMYRAQSNAGYEMENVNMADLPGVMWYLHNEVVSNVPRHYQVTRLLRFKVTYRTTESYYKAAGRQFTGFVAFDLGSCGHDGCAGKHGAVIGCQAQNPGQSGYRPLPGSVPLCEGRPEAFSSCSTGTWFSVPGPCPGKRLGHKDLTCTRLHGGGRCSDISSDPRCTYRMDPAGEVRLDELEGIGNYTNWLHSGKHRMEWNRRTDKGHNMTFWDDVHDASKCRFRMESVLRLFATKFPELPVDLPMPPCR